MVGKEKVMFNSTWEAAQVAELANRARLHGSTDWFVVIDEDHNPIVMNRGFKQLDASDLTLLASGCNPSYYPFKK